MTDGQIEKQKDRQTARNSERHSYIQTDRHTLRQTDRQTGWQMGYRQTDKRSEILQMLGAKTGQMIVLSVK
jgi:hypothetical protein